MQRDTISTLNELNAGHLASRPGFSELQARIPSYELAFQLQPSSPDAPDLSQDSAAPFESYVLNQLPPADTPLAL